MSFNATSTDTSTDLRERHETSSGLSCTYHALRPITPATAVLMLAITRKRLAQLVTMGPGDQRDGSRTQQQSTTQNRYPDVEYSSVATDLPFIDSAESVDIVAAASAALNNNNTSKPISPPAARMGDFHEMTTVNGDATAANGSAHNIAESSSGGGALSPTYDAIDDTVTAPRKRGVAAVDVERELLNQAEFDERYDVSPRPSKTLRESLRDTVADCECSGRCVKKKVTGLFPFLKIPMYYTMPTDFVNDLIAGLTVGVMQIPQGKTTVLKHVHVDAVAIRTIVWVNGVHALRVYD